MNDNQRVKLNELEALFDMLSCVGDVAPEVETISQIGLMGLKTVREIKDIDEA